MVDNELGKRRRKWIVAQLIRISEGETRREPGSEETTRMRIEKKGEDRSPPFYTNLSFFEKKRGPEGTKCQTMRTRNGWSLTRRAVF